MQCIYINEDMLCYVYWVLFGHVEWMFKYFELAVWMRLVNNQKLRSYVLLPHSHTLNEFMMWKSCITYTLRTRDIPVPPIERSFLSRRFIFFFFIFPLNRLHSTFPWVNNVTITTAVIWQLEQQTWNLQQFLTIDNIFHTTDLFYIIMTWLLQQQWLY